MLKGTVCILNAPRQLLPAIKRDRHAKLHGLQISVVLPEVSFIRKRGHDKIDFAQFVRSPSQFVRQVVMHFHPNVTAIFTPHLRNHSWHQLGHESFADALESKSR